MCYNSLLQDYLKYIQLEPTVPAELKADVLAIFCNLQDIYAFHNELAELSLLFQMILSPPALTAEHFFLLSKLARRMML